MDREEKILEIAMDSIIGRCTDIKNSLANFIFKLENEANYEPVDWPAALDNFALISSQVNNLMKTIRNEKTPPLRNRIFLPLALNPERDEKLAQMTENRVVAFNHEMVPNYLRTKPEPEIEEKERALYARSNNMSQDVTTKGVNMVNKIANSIIESVKTAREEWDNTESSIRAAQPQSSSMNDTKLIIQAISAGQGLRVGSDMPSKTGPQMSLPQQQPQQKPAPGKAPQAIKTNIKTSVGPYNR